MLDSSFACPDVGLGVGGGQWFNANVYGIAGFDDRIRLFGLRLGVTL